MIQALNFADGVGPEDAERMVGQEPGEHDGAIEQAAIAADSYGAELAQEAAEIREQQTLCEFCNGPCDPDGGCECDVEGMG